MVRTDLPCLAGCGEAKHTVSAAMRLTATLGLAQQVLLRVPEHRLVGVCKLKEEWLWSVVHLSEAVPAAAVEMPIVLRCGAACRPGKVVECGCQMLSLLVQLAGLLQKVWLLDAVPAQQCWCS